MDRISVSSNNVESLGYDADSETLEVEFKNGTVYQYFDVSERVYEELRDAASVGGYLATQVKGIYRYSKV